LEMKDEEIFRDVFKMILMLLMDAAQRTCARGKCQRSRFAIAINASAVA